MLRYKTKFRPGLVALYDIRPGNGAGPFLQPRSPHGAMQNVSHATLLAEIVTIIFSTNKKHARDLRFHHWP